MVNSSQDAFFLLKALLILANRDRENTLGLRSGDREMFGITDSSSLGYWEAPERLSPWDVFCSKERFSLSSC